MRQCSITALNITIVAAGQQLGTALVAGGQAGQVALLAGEDFSYALAEGESVSIELPGIGFVYAPVVEGEVAGIAHIFVNERPVGAVELIYGQTVFQTKTTKRSWFDKLFNRGR